MQESNRKEDTPPTGLTISNTTAIYSYSISSRDSFGRLTCQTSMTRRTNSRLRRIRTLFDSCWTRSLQDADSTARLRCCTMLPGETVRKTSMNSQPLYVQGLCCKEFQQPCAAEWFSRLVTHIYHIQNHLFSNHQDVSLYHDCRGLSYIAIETNNGKNKIEFEDLYWDRNTIE